MPWTQIERLVVFREKHKSVLAMLSQELLRSPAAMTEVTGGMVELHHGTDIGSLIQKFEQYVEGFLEQWPAQEVPDRLFAFGRSLAMEGMSRSAVAVGLNRLRRRITDLLSTRTLEDDSFQEVYICIAMAEDLVMTGCRPASETGEVETIVSPGSLDVPRLIRYVAMLTSLQEAQDALSEGMNESAREKLQSVADLKPHDPGVIRQLKWLTRCADALEAESRLSEVRRVAEAGESEKALVLAKTRHEPEKRVYGGFGAGTRVDENNLVTELHAQAVIAMEVGEYDDAQSLLDRASGINEKAETTLELKGRLKSLRKSADARILLDEAANHIANHQLDDARERLDKVRQIDPTNGRLATMLKQIDARNVKPESGLYEEGLAALDKADLDLATSKLRMLMANAADPVLIKSLRNKVEEFKHNKTIRGLQVEAERLIVEGDYENAARRLLQARSMSPDRPDTLELIDKLAKLSRLRGTKHFLTDAQAAFERGDYKAAETKVRQGLVAEPNNSDLIRVQNKVHQAMGKPKAEVEPLLTAARRSLDNSNASEALNILQQAHAIDPDHPETARLMRDARDRLGAGETLSFTPHFTAEPMSGVMRVNSGTEENDQSGFTTLAVVSHDPNDLIKDIEEARVQAKQLLPLPADFEYPLDDEDEDGPAPADSQAPSPDDSGIKTALPPKPKAVKPNVGGVLYHWMVTSNLDVPRETHFRYAMDKAVDFGALPIARDVLFLDPVFFGVFPQRGPHEMFYRHGGYNDWQTRLKEWLHLHEVRMRKHLSKLLPPEIPVDKLPRFGVLGRLGWQASHETTANTPSDKISALANDTDYHDDWEEFVRAINKKWDPEFLALLQCEAPDRTEGFEDLSIGGQRRRFARKKILADAWDHFAKVLFLFTLRTCKTMYPTIQWGFMGYPANLSVSDPTDVRAKMIYHQGMNDRMDWLFKSVDLIIPRYPTRNVSVPDGVKPSEAAKQNTSSQDLKSVEYNMGEAIRLRNTFAPGKPVLVANSYTYASNKSQTLNDINMDHNFRAPIILGVDGVLIHGQIESTADKEQAQAEINGKLGNVIKRTVDRVKRKRPE